MQDYTKREVVQGTMEALIPGKRLEETAVFLPGEALLDPVHGSWAPS